MKRVISLVAALSLVSNMVFADCKFNDLVHNPDGTVTYSKADHDCVGQLVQDNAVKTQQVQLLNSAVSLKDLALQKSDQRAQIWMDTSLKLEDNIQKIDTFKKQNEWIYFTLGVLFTSLAGVTAAQLGRGH